MPRKKKTETAELKTEAVAAETAVETAVKPAAEAPAPKPAKKPVEKKAAAEKKAPAQKKAPAKAKAPAAPKETVKVQYGGEEYDLAEIKKAVEADCKCKYSGKVKTVEIYVKPEDRAVYYVVNSEFSDKVVL